MKLETDLRRAMDRDEFRVTISPSLSAGLSGSSASSHYCAGNDRLWIGHAGEFVEAAKKGQIPFIGLVRREAADRCAPGTCSFHPIQRLP